MDKIVDYQGLTDGILKSVESYFLQEFNSAKPMYVVKYKGKLMHKSSGVRVFANAGGAKSFITTFVKDLFWHGEYYQNCKAQLFKNYGIEVDYTATIKILPSHGLTSRFESAEVKKMFKDIGTDLLNKGIFTIETI